MLAFLLLAAGLSSPAPQQRLPAVPPFAVSAVQAQGPPSASDSPASPAVPPAAQQPLGEPLDTAAPAPPGGTTHAQETAPRSRPTSASMRIEHDDPLEKANRGLYHLHNVIDKNALRPAAIGYQRAVPGPMRAGVRNAFANLGEPAVMVNDLLQLRPRAAASSLARFVLNSTFGLAGLVDVARTAGVKHHDNDFGSRWARWE